MKILSKPKGNAEEYGRWSVNPYKGCPHGCQYCYLKKGAWKKGLGGSMPTLKDGIVNEDHAFHLAWCEIIENREQIIKDGGLFMSFITDPLCEGYWVSGRDCGEGMVRTMFLALAKGSIATGIPVIILTKAVGFRNHFHYKDIAGKSTYYEISPELHNRQSMIAFGWTLTGHDELEPNAPSNEKRLQEMEAVKNDGLKVWASIEPVIDFDSSFAMIQQALDAGCRHFKIGLLTNNTKVVRSKYDMVKCCQFVGYVMELTERYGATVYWKQSFVDFLQVSKKDPQPVHGMTAREFLSQWKHSVGKDWSMFKTSAV